MKTRLLLILLFLTTLFYAQLPSDYVARYEFIGGSLENNATAGESGNLAGSIPASQFREDRFGRTNDAIRVNANELSGYTFKGTNNEVSVSFWWQGSAPTSSNQRIFQIFDGSGDGLTMRTAQTNTLIARFKNDGTDHQSSNTNMTIFDGNWHHIVFTIKKTSTGYDNSVYIDGTLHQVLSENIDSNNTSNFLTADARFILSASGVGFFGTIDDFQLFNRELTSQEITNIHNYTPPASYTTAYVDASATGNNDGSSWANAFISLQAALKYSRQSLSEIWVANGTYKPGIDRNTSFRLNIHNLKLYGGFAGTETTIAQRDLNNAATILSGDVNDDDTGVAQTGFNRAENIFHIMRLQANNVVIDGFQMNDGNAYRAAADPFGGAILASNNVNSLNLINCSFNNNVGRNGGAIRVSFSINASVNIQNCIFNNNLSRYGSGLYITADNSRSVTVAITNTLFANNVSSNDGAELGFTGSSAWIRASGINANITTTIANSTFANNTDIGTTATSQKGTLGLSRRADGRSVHNATIYNSIFYDNVGASSAITSAVNKGHTALANSIVVHNSLDIANFSNVNAANLNNIITVNPLFEDAANNNFTLLTGSAAIDAGDNTKVPSGIKTDLANNNRIFNTTVDMGAYEFGSSPLSTESNNLLSTTKLYPNPVRDNLNISSKEEIKKIEVYNLLGQKIIEKENSSTINLSNLKPNMYLVRVYSNMNSVSKRIIKN